MSEADWPRITADFIRRWRAWADSHDAAGAAALFADNPTLLSPVFYSPKQSKEYAVAVVCNALAVFENFRYVGEWTRDGGVILEFEANVGPHKLRGIDHFRLDEQGLITGLEVMIRPLNALAEVGERMKAKFAA
ncbi:nuclear transport factor 2 family protein [Camelimonas sp. ID_303_24]